MIRGATTEFTPVFRHGRKAPRCFTVAKAWALPSPAKPLEVNRPFRSKRWTFLYRPWKLNRPEFSLAALAEDAHRLQARETGTAGEGRGGEASPSALGMIGGGAGAEARGQGTMVEAWYMDDSREDPRKPHRPEPDRPVSLEQLSRIGVFYWKVGRAGGGGGRRACKKASRDLAPFAASLRQTRLGDLARSARQKPLTCALWRRALLWPCLGGPSP